MPTVALTDSVWNAPEGQHNWSTAANWTVNGQQATDYPHGAGDRAVFKGNSARYCDVDVNVSQLGGLDHSDSTLLYLDANLTVNQYFKWSNGSLYDDDDGFYDTLTISTCQYNPNDQNPTGATWSGGSLGSAAGGSLLSVTNNSWLTVTGAVGTLNADVTVGSGAGTDASQVSVQDPANDVVCTGTWTVQKGSRLRFSNDNQATVNSYRFGPAGATTVALTNYGFVTVTPVGVNMTLTEAYPILNKGNTDNTGGQFNLYQATCVLPNADANGWSLENSGDYSGISLGQSTSDTVQSVLEADSGIQQNGGSHCAFVVSAPAATPAVVKLPPGKKLAVNTGALTMATPFDAQNPKYTGLIVQSTDPTSATLPQLSFGDGTSLLVGEPAAGGSPVPEQIVLRNCNCSISATNTSLYLKVTGRPAVGITFDKLIFCSSPAGTNGTITGAFALAFDDWNDTFTQTVGGAGTDFYVTRTA